jgi:hypothetical protein
MANKPRDESQIHKFKEAARAAETVDDEAAFDRALKTVAGHTARDDDMDASVVIEKLDAAAERGKAAKRKR